jgi:SAM-dependent methyltransferase
MIKLTSSTKFYFDETEVLLSDKLNYLISEIKQNLFPDYSKNNIWFDFYNYILDNDILRKNTHIYRYLLTFGKMLDYLDLKKIKYQRIVETGDPSPILFFLSKLGAECYFTESDLRKNIDFENNFADVLLSFEVIEHLKDVSDNSLEEIVLFNQSGIKNYVNESKRVVKSNGQIYLSTPNPCSLQSLLLLINDEAPSIYRPHVREYSKSEIINLFNLKVIAYESNNCFFSLNKSYIDNKFKNYIKLLKNPGDDHFFLFQNTDKN